VDVDTSGGLGVLMGREIAEQPDVLDRIVKEQRPAIAALARRIQVARPRFVVFAARGTSDHAATYAKYLVEILLGLPAGLASPSSMTAYGARPDLRDVLFVAVSQSGGSPDLVESIATARACGALTLAVTNAPESPLAGEAELTIDVQAGPELAVAATKSYTAELLCLYLLFDAIRDGDGRHARRLATAADELTGDQVAVAVAGIADRFSGVERLVVTGRGYSYSTALEAALKLMETSYISAQAFSGADLMHGPMAMLQENSAVIAIAADGIGGRAMTPVLHRLAGLGTNLVVVGGSAANAMPLPSGIEEEVSPILEIIPLQMLARQLAIERGYDPDRPRGLLKVTQTW
jgi:glucosamine--fructose-6-phosphate aminotransferase (isomerizing)